MILNREATKSIRSAFGKTLEKLGHINSNIVVLDADLACSTQTQFFAKSFPDRFFDCGISEQHQVLLLTDCVHQSLPHYNSVVAEAAESLVSCKDWGDLEFASYYLFLSINK